MSSSAIKYPKRLFSQTGGDASLPARVTNLENNEYKVTYYEIISGTSGSLTIPSQATINAGEFGLSENAILSKIDGSNKPTFESPKTSGGVVVTASLTASTGAWVTSGTYTDSSVALIYSIKIKAIYYSNLTYSRIIETVNDNGDFLSKNNNLSDLVNVATAKVNLNIDKRITVGDANYTILTTDKEVVTSAALTASRTYTLPTGETAGQEFIVADEFQALGTYTITVGVATGKKLNGVTNGTVTMVTAGGHRRFFGDGNGNYTFDAGIARLGVSQTFTATNTFSTAPVFTDYVGTRNAQKVYDMFMTNGDQLTTSSSASNITDLVSVSLTANKRYKIHGIIHVGCNNTGGVKIQVTIPTGATIFLMTNGFTSGSTVNAWSGINASATLGAAFCTANSTGGCIMVNGEVSLSSTSGTIQFGFASGVNTQTSTIYQLGTQIILTQIN